jgi:hypothetical protein
LNVPVYNFGKKNRDLDVLNIYRQKEKTEYPDGIMPANEDMVYGMPQASSSRGIMFSSVMACA